MINDTATVSKSKRKSKKSKKKNNDNSVPFPDDPFDAAMVQAEKEPTPSVS